jgi:AcrR family transcriptional regulator
VTTPRRTQAERTAATRGALLAATVACLVERGYRATTTTEVAHRAGVSAGALLHHFPTRVDLLVGAVSHLIAERNAEFRKAMTDVPTEADRGLAAVDLLWGMFSGPAFVAWLELWVGARNDHVLAAAVVQLDRDFMATSEAVFRELFVEETAANPDLPRTAIGLLFALLDGLALSRLIPGYEPLPVRDVLDAFTALIRPALPLDPGGS